MIDLEGIWAEYDLDRLQKGIHALFPAYDLELSALLGQVLTGDILGAMAQFLQGLISEMALSAEGMKNVFVWLVVLGMVAALMTHFIEVFDKHQIADLGFYFIYLLTTTILLKCFAQVLHTAADTIENIIVFVQLLVPTYMISVGLAAGTTTVGAYYQLLLFIIYGVQEILLGVVLPFTYSLCLLSIVNGIWVEERLQQVIALFEKCISWILKAALGVVTGVSIFQAVITPVIDSVKKSSLQKAISAIPGIGNAADGVVELVAGSAVVIKNSIGVILLILLLVLCAAPIFQIFSVAFILKGAAAFMGIVGNKRITSCVDRTGDICMLLLRTTATAILLFMITLAVVATATNRGF